MNDAPSNPTVPGRAGSQREGWSQKKWLTVIAIIFAAHVAIIFALGEKKQIVPLAVTNVHKIVPNLKLADSSSELLVLDDPTLFALPHLEGFAGPAWLQSPRVQFHRRDWTEQPRWLPLPAENLGATFQQFMQTNFFAGHTLDFKPEAKSSALTSVEPASVQDSTMQIEGELAQRQLPGEINLPSLQYSDVIAPSKVQMLVNEAGNVVSAILLESSGFKDADDKSLELARAARFAPAKNLTVGQMVFNWRTIPMTTTNDNPNAH